MDRFDVVLAAFNAVFFYAPSVFWAPRGMCAVDVKQTYIFQVSPKQETILPHVDSDIQYGCWLQLLAELDDGTNLRTLTEGHDLFSRRLEGPDLGNTGGADCA